MLMYDDETDAVFRFQLLRWINDVKVIAWGRLDLKGQQHANANMDRCATVLDPDRDKQYCELCGKMEDLLKCGRCRISFYCSKEHQKEHWKKHKLTCREADNTKIVPQTPHQQKKPSDPDRRDLINRTESSDTDSSTTKPQTHKLATEYIVPCMNKHGICVVDNFLGEDLGLSILEDVKALHQTGKFTDGQLVSQKSDSTKDIRGDKITWIEGKEPGCEKICFLMSRMDDLVRNCNGKLGNYTINGRTKLLEQGCRHLAVPPRVTSRGWFAPMTSEVMRWWRVIRVKALVMCAMWTTRTAMGDVSHAYITLIRIGMPRKMGACCGYFQRVKHSLRTSNPNLTAWFYSGLIDETLMRSSLRMQQDMLLPCGILMLMSGQELKKSI